MAASSPLFGDNVGKNQQFEDIGVLQTLQQAHGEPPDFIAADLLAAVEWILEDIERAGS